MSEELHDQAPGQRMRRVLLAGLLILLPIGIAVQILGIRDASYGDLATIVTIAAAGWLWLVALQARSSMRLRQGRQGFRATENLDVLNSSADLAVVGVSPFGIDVASTRKLEVGDRLRLAFALPAADGSTARMETATVVRRARKEGKRYVAYLRFALINDDEMDRVIEYCAVVAGHREMRDESVHMTAELVVEYHGAFDAHGADQGPETGGWADKPGLGRSRPAETTEPRSPRPLGHLSRQLEAAANSGTEAGDESAALNPPPGGKSRRARRSLAGIGRRIDEDA